MKGANILESSYDYIFCTCGRSEPIKVEQRARTAPAV